MREKTRKGEKKYFNIWLQGKENEKEIIPLSKGKLLTPKNGDAVKG